MADLQGFGRALQGFGAGVAGRGQQFLQGLDENRKNALLQDAFAVQQQLTSGDVSGARATLMSRLDAGNRLGGSVMSDTQALLQKLESGDVAGALTDVGTVVSFAQSQGLLKAPATVAPKQQIVGGQLVTIGPKGAVATDIQGFKRDPKSGDTTSSQRDFKQFKALEKKAKESGLPEDAEAAEQFGRQSRFLRLDEESLSDLKVTEAERRSIVKATVARKQGFIDSGITAADSTASLRRGLDLLKTVKTGGFDSAAFRAKQLFGIEGADELELSTNMGINVLAQLKPIFGAAFTAAEGERLERISAGFGRSVPGNTRLMEQALKIADRAARRGLAAAIDQDDAFTAGEIRDALKFKIDDTPLEQPAQADAPAAPAQGAQAQGAAPATSDADLLAKYGVAI